MSKLGYRTVNGKERWHPSDHFLDYMKWSETPAGKAQLKENAKKNQLLIDQEKFRTNPENHNIDYKKELERLDLSIRQRQRYRELLDLYK